MKLSSPVDLIKKSLQIFFVKKNLTYFLGIYLFLLPFSVFAIFQGDLTKSTAGLLAPVGLIYLFIYLLVWAAGIEAVRRVISRETLSFKNTFQVAWKKIWKFSLVSVLMFFVVGLGLVFLVVPGIIFAVWFSFSRFVAIEENLSVTKSLARSRELVKGRFWKVLGRLLVIGIFFVAAEMLVGLMPYGIGSVLITLSGALFILPSYLLYRELRG